MSFDTVTFWLFLPLAWLAWRKLPLRFAKLALVALSLGFYAWWSPLYVVLIVGSAAVDFRVGRALVRTTGDRGRRAWVALSVTCNLGLLAFFKYTPLAAETWWSLRGEAPDVSPFAYWVVPVGISFYTFQTLSYTIDLYRRRVAPAPDFHTFLLYVSLFPQLVAGPIVRARQLLPQLEGRAPLSLLRVRYGAYRCVEGLFLKVVVADGIAPAVQRAFDTSPGTLSPVGAWYAAVLFGAQIFADFAGYTGIAIGIACLMGLRFPENFRAPYIATSLAEFWRRWHISLSTWLRDYLYVPLGGNRRGPWRTYVNLAIVMLLGGLWHGASWNYVIWGALHGAGLAIGRAWQGRRSASARPNVLQSALCWLVVFAFVHVAWVLFRAQDLASAQTVLNAMLVQPFAVLRGASFVDGAEPGWRFAVLLLPLLVIHLAQWSHERFGWRRSELGRSIACGLMLLALTVFERRGHEAFLYFQF